MIQRSRFSAGTLLLVLLTACATQKKTPGSPSTIASKPLPPAGTGLPAQPPGVSASNLSQRTLPKSFAGFFDKSKVRTQKGVFTVHWQDDKYYFEIPHALLNKDLLAVTRFSRMTPGAGVYGGEQANQNVLRFERGPENRIFIRNVLHVVASPDSTKPIFQAVQNSNIEPIAAAFDIKAYNADTTGVVIDVTDFFKGDNQIVSLPPQLKRVFGLTALAPDRSYVESIHAFQDNAEIKTVKTFLATPPSGFGPPQPGQPISLPAASAAGVVTMELNTSFIRLPDVPMKRRFFDSRVGYFADEVTEFLDTTQRSNKEAFIVRWRLEPKPEDRARYKRGELVEPQKQIVYYIDPSTPAKWVPYLIQGINDWQKAFEKAGFKNAIVGKVWPKDSTMSLDAANYSAIRYLASDITNAYGPRIHDPRSGEILESHIGWYHDVMKLVQNWYFVQASAIDPAARKMVFDDDLMGNLIRFVSSHEVGHTLGLRHNMGTSSKTPVEKLRDKAWVEKNGHTLSIMDYARFNYVAQPEDKLDRTGIYPRIGEYDLWAIEWGYRWTDEGEEQDRKNSNQLVVDRLEKNPNLWFGGEGRGYDPRAQLEDLGDDAMKASAYGIKNLKRVIKNLPEWTHQEGDRYENLREMYGAVLGQYFRYANHVAKHIGGFEETFKSVEESGSVYAPTAKQKQKNAVAWLQQYVFTTPSWLLDQTILNKISEPVNNSVSTVQTSMIAALFTAPRLNRLIESRARFGSESYPVLEFLDDLRTGIWEELTTDRPIDLYRRNLQKAYVERLLALLPSASALSQGATAASSSVAPRTSDIPSIVQGHLTDLRVSLIDGSKRTKDKMTRYHLMDLAQRIEQTLRPR